MCSVKDQFKVLVCKFNDIDNSKHKQDSVEYQEGLSRFISEVLEFKKVVYDKLCMFSTNESIEDVATESIPFLSIDFYLAQLMVKKQYVGNDFESKYNSGRYYKIQWLAKSVQLHMQFLMCLYDYDLLDSKISSILERIKDKRNPTLEELFPQPRSKTDIVKAEQKRQIKIEFFKQNKRLEKSLERLESEYRVHEQENEDGNFGIDEEVKRKLYLTALQHQSMKSFNELEGILMELELLNNIIKMGSKPDLVEADADKGELRPFEYTAKVEVLNKPILSKHGKVLRNFTLLDKQSQFKNGVFGYGQYGPTMTVEELLEKEFESGRVLQGGEEVEKEVDEDNEEWNNKQTYKAREWDEFKEANPRGSGNTMNNG